MATACCERKDVREAADLQPATSGLSSSRHRAPIALRTPRPDDAIGAQREAVGRAGSDRDDIR